jgi:hypothetical protein
MYFVELRTGYRWGWFQKGKSQLIMQPHTLSRLKRGEPPKMAKSLAKS